MQEDTEAEDVVPGLPGVHGYGVVGGGYGSCSESLNGDSRGHLESGYASRADSIKDCDGGSSAASVMSGGNGRQSPDCDEVIT